MRARRSKSQAYGNSCHLSVGLRSTQVAHIAKLNNLQPTVMRTPAYLTARLRFVPTFKAFRFSEDMLRLAYTVYTYPSTAYSTCVQLLPSCLVGDGTCCSQAWQPRLLVVQEHRSKSCEGLAGMLSLHIEGSMLKIFQMQQEHSQLRLCTRVSHQCSMACMGIRGGLDSLPKLVM